MLFFIFAQKGLIHSILTSYLKLKLEHLFEHLNILPKLRIRFPTKLQGSFSPKDSVHIKVLLSIKT